MRIRRRRPRRTASLLRSIPWRQVWPLALFALIGLIVLIVPHNTEPDPLTDSAATPAPAQTQTAATTPPAVLHPNVYIPGPEISVYDDEEDCVFTISLEDYIEGVVAGEMPITFSDEAIKAQAVAARTYALRKLPAYGGSECGRSGATICTDSAHCQAYRSPMQQKERWGSDYDANYARLTSLVQATAGQIVTYDGGAIEAFFHSTSGGRTENSENAFSAALPYLRSVESPGEESAPRFRSETKIPRSEFVKKINKSYSKAKLSDKRLESEVEVLSRFESGRVEELKVGGVKATGREIRKLFGLDSSNFSISFEKKAIVFSTIGYGHGVGMSQTGADYMARAGYTYVQILTHYYTDTQVSRAY